MSAIISALGSALGVAMRICYQMVDNYGVAIVLFTLFSKMLLLPLSVWLHKNSIKIIKLQATINDIKADYYGDTATIADKQAALFKKEKYNPLANLIPLIIQIVLLMGLIEVIYHPLHYILGLPADLIQSLTEKAVALTGANPGSSTVQLTVIDAIKSPEWSAHFTQAFTSPQASSALTAIKGLQMQLLGLDVCRVPSEIGGWMVLVPIAAGFSSWLLCFFQNSKNVLQSEQGVVNKYGTMLLSVGLSLYLGWFVPVGVALYWVVSNIYAILQMLVLNTAIRPSQYVDYDDLERSRERLRQLEALQGKSHSAEAKKNSKREKEDYKRFFSVANKHLVFYSEKSGYYKFFQNIIEYLIANSNIIVHYVTNDPDDMIFALAKEQPRIHPYYIGYKKAITLMMRMDADIVVMTTPDLNNYYLKRSYMRSDIEYIYTFHGVASTNMVVRKGAYDHFDTIFCVGQHQVDELRETEAMHHLPAKNLVQAGYGLLDTMMQEHQSAPPVSSDEKHILIAPSWQEGNILDSCIDEMLESLLGKGYQVTLRPHPEYIKRFPVKWEALVSRYQSRVDEKFVLESDFSSSASVFLADMLITDWSGIAYEYAYVTLRPVLFIDTPMKVLNEEYDQYKELPLDISLRNQVGVSLKPEEACNTAATIERMFASSGEYQKKILEIRGQYVFHLGEFGKMAGSYILHQLIKKRKSVE